MLYELTLTPHVFDKSYIEESPSGSFRELVEILKSASKNGLLISLNKDEWLRESMQRLSYLSPEFRDKIQVIFKRLKDRNLIVKIPKTQIQANTEEQWIEVARLSENGIPFRVMIATKHYEEHVCHPLELIDNEMWEQDNNQTIYIDQTEENMRNHFSILLRYAKKVQIIDPYFNVLKPRYKKSLELISELFSSRRGNKTGGSIIIHCKYDDTVTPNAEYEKKWREVKDQLFKKYNHIYTIHIWKETDKKMHDRFIITDQFGLHIGSGLDIKEQNKTSWALIDNDAKREILNDYQENSSPFALYKTL